MKNVLHALAVMVSCFCFLCVRAEGQVNVVTYHNDAARTGQNLSETILNTSNVNANQFGKLFSQPVDGFIDGNALYLSNVTIPGKGTHNVVYVGTMNDTMYAFDADSNQGADASPLWSVSFTNPAAGITVVPVEDLSCVSTTEFRQMGIEGTSVIDPNTGTLYAVVKTLENGVYVNRIHALDVTTGAEKFGGPVVVTGSVLGSNGAPIPFIDQKQMVRPALLLTNGVLYTSFGSLGCNGGGVHGWLMAWNATTLQQLGIFCTTPNVGGGAGFWFSNGGPAADLEGNVFTSTADGIFDEYESGGDYGDTLLKIALQANGLAVADYFTPFNQATLKTDDLDLGAGGILVLPDQPGSVPHMLVTGGKGGTLYLINRDNLGQYCNGCTGDPQIVQSILNFGSVRATPAYWNGTVYAAGGNGITAYSLQGGMLTSMMQTIKLGNLSSPIISANGTTNGILWAMNKNLLYAFDASNLANNLYNSKINAPRDGLDETAHFAGVVEANGKVYVGTTTQLVVFGVFQGLTPAAGNNQTGVVNTVLPNPIQVQAINPYNGSVYSGITVTFSDGGKGGTFSNPSVVTDSNGFASTTYTLPKRALSYTITASSTGVSSATFEETAIPGNPFKLGLVSGAKQTAPVSTALPAPIVVTVLDANGNAIAGLNVTFSDGGAGGTFSANPVATAATGRATVTYTNPPNPGIINLTVSAPGLTTLKLTETATAQ
jgi:protocatechuate 3,4-dioxygenase beta subunit